MLRAFIEDAFHHSSSELQVNPAWVITFVRWNNRALGTKEELNYQRANQINSTTEEFFKTEPLLIVDNDCIALSVNNSKSSITPAAQAVLKMGSYDYLTAIAPGDYMLINMLDSEEEARNIVDLAKKGQAINKYEHGFKGIFKVKSVRKIMSVDKKSGLKTQNCIVQGYAFSELNNTVYFNPHLINRSELKNDFLFFSNISDQWRSVLARKDGNSVQDLVVELFKLFVGIGLSGKNSTKGLMRTPNTHFFVPSDVGRLLGENNAKAVKDIYNLIFGKQVYEAGEMLSPEVGFNPSNFTSSNSQMPRLKTPSDRNKFCEGVGYVQAEYWQMVTVHSIMQQYLNSPINEMYSCFRVDTDGYVMPTLVMRQIPFSSEEYKTTFATKFLNLPRWYIPTEYLYEMNIGREDAARFNFVQVFGQINFAANPEAGISSQIAQGNYVIDKADILKNGLRPYNVTSNFDSISGVKQNSFKSVNWAKLMADCLVGGHLKMNGTIAIPGVAKPIAVGDNLQVQNMVFHIESVTHSCAIEANGEKVFSTTVEVSNGILDQYLTKERYIGMKNSNISDAEKTSENIFGIVTSKDSFGEKQLPNTSFTSFDPKNMPEKTDKPKPKKKTSKRKIANRNKK